MDLQIKEGQRYLIERQPSNFDGVANDMKFMTKTRIYKRWR